MDSSPPAHHRPTDLDALAARLAAAARPTDRPLLVACSGGLDSTALALAAARALPGAIVIAHVDHALRPTSARDAAHTARLAASLRAPFGLARLDWPAGPPPGPAEGVLRQRRYRALAGIARRHGCYTVATAHHRDDQIETVLFRLLRGTGWRGYVGIRERRAFAGDLELWRPLLDASRAALRRAVVGDGLDWVEDPSNALPGPARNRLRHRILPALRERTDGAIDARLLALRAAALAAERLGDSVWRTLQTALTREPDGTVHLPLTGDEPETAIAEAARRLHAELAGARALERWVGRVVDLARGRPGRRLDAAPGLGVARTRTRLVFTPRTAPD